MPNVKAGARVFRLARIGVPIKAAIAGFVLSAGVSWIATKPEYRAQLSEIILQLRGWVDVVFQLIADILGLGEPYAEISEKAFGTYIFFTLTIVLFFIFYPLLLKKFRGRCLVEYLWSAQPDILNDKLVRPQDELISAFSAKSEFIGREEQIQHLMRFAGSTKQGQSAVMSLIGKEGVGKTRTALEWLKRLQKLGWDVGLLDTTTPVITVQRAAFRTKTAIVLDDPTKFWPLLDALLQKRKRICVLLTSQFQIEPLDSLSDSARRRYEEAAHDPLRIEGLSDDDALILTPGMSASAMRSAEGRPLYLLMGEDPAAEIARRVQRRVDAANDANQRKILLLAAMAGPFTQEQRKAIPGTKVRLSKLTQLFEGEDTRVLKTVVPALKPQLFSAALVAKLASDLSDADADEMVRLAGNLNMEALERQLGSLFLNKSKLSSQLTDTIDFLILSHDENHAHLADEYRVLAATYFERTTQSPYDIEQDTSFAHLEKALAGFEQLAAVRPWDFTIRHHEAIGAVNAISDYGKTRRFDDLERWGARLTALAEHPDFAANAGIRLEEAMGAMNAISSYGKAGRFDDLERWGARLIALAEHPDFAAVAAIRIGEAKGAVNAASYYGKAGRFDDLERWGARLITLAQHPKFAADAAIRLREAMGAVNAINGYGKAGRFDDLERWGARLIALAQHPDFAADAAIRLREAIGAVNATSYYGQAGRFDDLEQWGARLIALAEHPDFATDAAIRLHEAMGAVNVIIGYGKAGRFDDLERWAARLTALAHHPDFAADAAIRLEEAKGAMVLMSGYGRAGKFDDLERWGVRLIALAEHPDFAANAAIRVEEAMGVVNAINGYGKAGRFDDLERWGARLIALAQHPGFAANAAIQLHGAQGAVNAINDYGKARRFDDLERWGVRLIDLAEHPDFAANAAIRVEEAMGAVNAINGYGKAGRSDDLERWRNRLAKVASAFPHVLEIQEVAGNSFVTYVEQASKKRPKAR